ncbi:MAG: DegT/DnrJ/EryC1/StrS family aminotransferase [Planctomycetales bacterium]|nr:DegT/DnrJ/EryC1/StrS family aminotransferase [Planctomycetales bacterium]
MADTRTTSPQLTFPSDQDASGRNFGQEELDNLVAVLKSGVLTSTKGTFVKELETQFAARLGVAAAHACTSGTAALHTAVSAIDPEPGQEIVVTPITDMGALTPVLYQGAIPVFADVDPVTFNITAETIERCLSDRTRAIMVTHLFGQPCDMNPIMELARSRNIPVIEDCAQAYGAEYEGRPVGTMGDIGCFSLQQGKHITTGEGGLVTTNDPDYARRMYLFINKAWGYGDEKPDHYFIALNYRMNEITGAVALAQLQKLDQSVSQRVAMAEMMHERLAGLAGLALPTPVGRTLHTYWKYCPRVDAHVLGGGTDALGRLLKEQGIFCAPRYIQKPAFRCQVFRDQCTFGNSRFPFNLARSEAVDYSDSLFPGTFKSLATILVLPWNEAYTEEHVDAIASAIRNAVHQLS